MEQSSKKIKKSISIIHREIKKIGKPIAKRWNKHDRKSTDQIDKTWLNEETTNIDGIADHIVFAILRDHSRVTKAEVREPKFKRTIIKAIKKELKS